MTDKTKFFTVLDMNLVRAFDTEEPDAVIDINNVWVLVIVFIKADNQVFIFSVWIPGRFVIKLGVTQDDTG